MKRLRQSVSQNKRRNSTSRQLKCFIFRRRPTFELLEVRQMLTAVSWDGGGGNLLWSNALNWSNNQLPTTADDVTIDASGSVTVTYDVANATTIKSLTLSDSLNATGKSLTITDTLAIAGGKALTMASAASTFSAQGVTSINGVSLIVTTGTLSLPGLTSYTETTGATFQATGTGSVLDLPNVSIITGINSGSQHRFPIKTTSGGRINLPQVTQIVSPAGAGNGTGIDVSTDGANSRIDLPASPRSSTTI